jgi:hypothetical protein
MHHRLRSRKRPDRHAPSTANALSIAVTHSLAIPDTYPLAFADPFANADTYRLMV